MINLSYQLFNLSVLRSVLASREDLDGKLGMMAKTEENSCDESTQLVDIIFIEHVRRVKHLIRTPVLPQADTNACPETILLLK